MTKSKTNQKTTKTVKKKSSKVKKVTDSGNIYRAFFNGYEEDKESEKERFLKLFEERLQKIASNHGCADKYNILVLFDESTMIRSDADRIYKAISRISKDTSKPTLLILTSNGGDPRSAYLIGKLCRELSEDKNFIIVVPRNAKSAATLLVSGADEVHMGSLSELGPIDPQINKMPALGLKNAIETIAGIVDEHPGSAELFARYLHRSIEPVEIGYYERAAESAKQYAIRLMTARRMQNIKNIEEVADKLVYDYKDHGFVIDKAEACAVFGDGMVKVGTEEYELGNAIYTMLAEIKEFVDAFKYNFYYIGDLNSEPQIWKRKR